MNMARFWHSVASNARNNTRLGFYSRIRVYRMLPETVTASTAEAFPKPKTAHEYYVMLSRQLAQRLNHHDQPLTEEQVNRILMEYAYRGSNLVYKN